MTAELKTEVEFSKVIRERHSVRKYDPSWKISDEEIKEILGKPFWPRPHPTCSLGALL